MQKYTRTDDNQAQPLTREESERLMDELRLARQEFTERDLAEKLEESLDSDSK